VAAVKWCLPSVLICVLQLTTPFRQAKLHVERVAGAAVKVSTRNVQRWSASDLLGSASSLVPALRSSGLVIDSHTFTAAQLGSNPLHFHKSADGVWQQDSEHDISVYQEMQRGPATYGPARNVVAKPWLLVVGTDAPEAEQRALANIAIYIAAQHFAAQDTTVSVVNDTDGSLSDRRIGTHNLLLVGSGSVNKISRQLPHTAGVQFDGAAFSLGGCTFAEPGIGLVSTASHRDPLTGEQHLDLILAGTDIEGIRTVTEYSFASNQALTRAPFTNMVPDYLVAGHEFRRLGYGGILALGHWGNDWQFQADVGYLNCEVTHVAAPLRSQLTCAAAPPTDPDDHQMPPEIIAFLKSDAGSNALRAPIDDPDGRQAVEMMAQVNSNSSEDLVALAVEMSGGSLDSANVVELGPGHGFGTRALLKLPVASVHAVELSPLFRMLLREDEILVEEERKKRLTIAEEDCVSLSGLPDGSVDVILSMNVVYFLHPLENYLSEFARVLRPGGILLFGTKQLGAKLGSEDVFRCTDNAVIVGTMVEAGFEAQVGETRLVTDPVTPRMYVPVVGKKKVVA
jgi:SAM-dependent methyltransferase